MNMNLVKCSPIAVLNGIAGIKRSALKEMVKNPEKSLSNEAL